MKKLLFLFIITFASDMLAQNLPVIPWNVRRPDLYYYGSNWIDSSLILHPDSAGYIFHSNGVSGYLGCGAFYMGRPCVTQEPMRIIGIAAPVYKAPLSNTIFLDTNYAPEYFKLYQHEGDSIYFKAEARWDTTTPQYKFEPTSYYDPLPLYEAYFDKPVIVHDTFYVGGTTNSNLLYGWDEETGEYVNALPHPRFFYFSLDPCKSLPCPLYNVDPDPAYQLIQFYSTTLYEHPLSGMYSYDTTTMFIWEPEEMLSLLWLPFFAIFDTNYVPGVGTYDDSCMAPTGLHVEWIEENYVALAWNAGGETMWDLSIAAEGTNPNNGVLAHTAINFLIIDSLEPGHWYTARVRTLCDTDVFGDWSDPIQFWYGDSNDSVSCPTPAGLQVVSTDVGKVVLQWAQATGVVSWETEVGPVGTEPGSGSVVPAPTYFTLRYGLDTATWHWVRVRAKCGTDWYSLWSDTVMFYIPGGGSGPDNPDTNINDTTTAINYVELYTYLMPNPAREEVTVMSSFRIKSVELYGSDGKLLQTKEVNGVGTKLSLEGLPAGVYFVRVRTSAGVTTKRMVIQP